MTSRNRAIIGVVMMSALLVMYFVFVGVRAVALLQSSSLIAIAMGIALLTLPIIGFWALVREILFGYRSTQLIDQLESQQLLPDDLGEVPRGGRPDRSVAESVFEKYQKAIEDQPESWQAWVRLAIVYDACRDRTRARAALREAIQLSRFGIRS